MMPSANPARIRAERESRAWTQDYLAECANVSLSTIRRLEKTGNGRLSTLQQVADALSLPVTVLSERTSDEMSSIQTVLALKEGFEREVRPYTFATKKNPQRVFVVDAARRHEYLESGSTAYFRSHFHGLYFGGISLFIELLPGSITADGKWRVQEPNYVGDDAVHLHLVGRISFDDILGVDFRGNEYYQDPHIYCNFHGSLDSPYIGLQYLCEMSTGYLAALRAEDRDPDDPYYETHPVAEF